MLPPPNAACPNDERLVAFVESTLDEKARREIEEHLDLCSECARLIATYAGVYLSAEPADALATTEGYGDVVARLQSGAALPPGSVVGRYVVLDCVGEGASSIVYGAYDPELDRKVALKVLRAALGAGASMRETQLREARAMAKLAHANIVSVHDVGVDGERVFIAMEYVDGFTLRAWLELEARSIDEILHAMIEAGRGLAAIHAAGLVHRDFKPDNVLVGKDGRARVTDLGLARVTRADVDVAAPAEDAPAASSKRGAWTNAIAGTPAYMAPEQRAGQRADARSDQYAFAVTLHEALFGERPREGEAHLVKLASIPPRASKPPPSTRRVSSRVRAAVARGLSEKPGDRFPSMRDMVRALEPTGARARNIALGAVAVALVATGSWAVTRATTERARVCNGADAEITGAWDAARKSAIEASFRATSAPFAEDAWKSVERAGDAYAASWVSTRTEACEATRVRGAQSDAVLTLRMDCLDRRRRELVALVDLFSRADRDVVEHAASAMERLAPIGACSDTSALLASVRPPESPDTKKRVDALRDDLDRLKTLDASGKSALALADAKKDAAEANAIGYRPALAEALYVEGTIEGHATRYADAAATLGEAVDAAEAGKHDVLAAEIWATLVDDYVHLDRFDDAERCVERARAAIERTSGAGRAPLILPDAIGSLERELGHYPRAIEQHRAAIALEERTLGGDRLEVATSLANLANALRDDDQLDAALEAYKKSLAIREKILGGEHPDVASTLHSLAIFYGRLGRYDEAIPLFQRALAIRESAFGPESPAVGETLGSLVVSMRWSGDAPAALPLAERAVAIEAAANGTNHDLTAGALGNVGFVEMALHHTARAKEFFRKALAIREALFGANNAKVAIVVDNLGQAALAEGDFAEALKQYERGFSIEEKALRKDHPDLAYSLVGLGLANLGLKRADRAVPLLERAVDLREKGKAPPRAIAEARFALARALWESGGDRRRATSLAEQSRAGYHASGRAFVEDEANVTAWLAKNSAR